ncbi:hypothetical protein [Candidatus Symbiothrix dinenymphae]|uniref:hypothetical protein n=1 Tax=Candidatus Symbiothrix dinenymphae TaxID=467085 RepID=UPI0007038185|nr:hypothetical protein [Candidatus Symbiothrix dinenymphae]
MVVGWGYGGLSARVIIFQTRLAHPHYLGKFVYYHQGRHAGRAPTGAPFLRAVLVSVNLIKTKAVRKFVLSGGSCSSYMQGWSLAPNSGRNADATPNKGAS